MSGQPTREELAKFKMTNIERGLAVLELLAEHPPGLGISAISRELELPKNFVFRATSLLHLLGYVERDEDSKAFSLSRKLLSMGYHVLRHTSLIEIAMPLMRGLRNEVQETVTVCAIEDAQGIVLDHVPSPHRLRLVVETGAHFHLHSSAPGKAMLAFLPDADLEAMLARLTFERFTESTLCTRAKLEAALAEVRRRGYAVDQGEEYEGIRCVSAPILDKKGHPVAALVVTGPSNRFRDSMLSGHGILTRDTALTVSRKLGHAEE